MCSILTDLRLHFYSPLTVELHLTQIQPCALGQSFRKQPVIQSEQWIEKHKSTVPLTGLTYAFMPFIILAACCAECDCNIERCIYTVYTTWPLNAKY